MAKCDADRLSDGELRSKLAEYGHPVGPVTETTRKILIKKLKLLEKQKNWTNNFNKSLTKFSSGDESGSDADQNGGRRNPRRKSMPPPSNFKLRKRRSTPPISRVDSPTAPISPVSPSSPTVRNRINADLKVSACSTPQSFFRGQSRYSEVVRNPIVSWTHTREFESGSDSDVSEKITSFPLSTRRKSGPAHGVLSSYRSSRLSNSIHGSSIRQTLPDPFSMRLKNQIKKEARDWVKPLESAFDYFKSKDGSFKSNYKSRNNGQLLSMLLLAVFLLFFVWLALAYFRASQKLRIAGKSINSYPICGIHEPELSEDSCIPKEDLPYAIRLYKDVHVELHARGLRYLCGSSGNGSTRKPHATETEVINFLMKTRREGELESLIRGVKNLKLLVWTNRHWGISLVDESANMDSFPVVEYLSEEISPVEVKKNAHAFVCHNLSVPWSCSLARFVYKFLLGILAIASCGCTAYLLLLVWNHLRKKRKEEGERVMAMVEKILDFMESRSKDLESERGIDVADRTGNGGLDSNGSPKIGSRDYVAVRHVHDTLINPAEREKMAAIWKKAVKFIEENESRIRTEVQQVWGEDSTVWRWLAPTWKKSPSIDSLRNPDSGNESSVQLYPDLSSLKAEAKRCSDRVWQGEAFETSEGSMNCLPSSPTQCLKIRHMFKHDKDYGPDWVVKVKDAIVEKCEGAKIVHLSVDKESKEGCVYVKCASPPDAGRAYRQLHGSWFDGALVTVKYLRLERYHERFPDSAEAKTPLRPSNNLRLSLRGTSS